MRKFLPNRNSTYGTEERRGEVINEKGMSGEGVRNCKGEGAVDSNLQQDTIRPGKIVYC